MIRFNENIDGKIIEKYCSHQQNYVLIPMYDQLHELQLIKYFSKHRDDLHLIVVIVYRLYFVKLLHFQVARCYFYLQLGKNVGL